MNGHVYIYPVKEYLAGKKLKVLALAALWALISGEPSVRGTGAYVVSRWLVLKGYVTEKVRLEGGWRIEKDHSVTARGFEFYSASAGSVL